MGHRWGFYMLDIQTVDDSGQAVERLWQYDRITNVSIQAHSVQDKNLYHLPNFEEGRFTPQPYPWIRKDHLTRSDELVELLNAEILEASKGDHGKPTCIVKQ